MINNSNKVSPVFKYIGGKTWLREQLRTEISTLISNKQYDYYIEPFSGGLGAFLSIYDLLLQNNIKNIILNDINSQLVNFYKDVYYNPKKLIHQYMSLENQFKKTFPRVFNSKEDLENAHLFYKKIRENFNDKRKNKNNDISAYLLFLQNHGFNGIYRENSSGGYNTPFNWEAKTFTIEQISQKVMNVHFVLKHFNIEFINSSCYDLDYSKNGIYYIDPPYFNGEIKQENKYNQSGFNIKDQEKLIKSISKSSFIYSNHESETLLSFFQKHVKKEVNIKFFSRKNIISASKESRKTDKVELLISSK